MYQTDGTSGVVAVIDLGSPIRFTLTSYGTTVMWDHYRDQMLGDVQAAHGAVMEAHVEGYVYEMPLSELMSVFGDALAGSQFEGPGRGIFTDGLFSLIEKTPGTAPLQDAFDLCNLVGDVPAIDA